MASVKPVLQALVLADHIYEDVRTRKKVIAGTFNAMQIAPKKVEEIPSTEEGKIAVRVEGGTDAGSPWAYINLTEIHGKVPFTLQYVDLKHHSVLLKSAFAIECKNPLENVELIIPLPKLPAPHAGTYALELLSDDYPIGSLRIEVTTESPKGSN